MSTLTLHMDEYSLDVFETDEKTLICYAEYLVKTDYVIHQNKITGELYQKYMYIPSAFS